MKSIRRERGRNELLARRTIFVAVAALFSDAAIAQALPTVGTVATGNGTATITQSGAAMTVETSQRVIIDWTTFNIGNGASVTFQQAGTNPVAVNRVGLAGGASAIDGALSANGNVMILNPNGVMFGANAVVNVAGLVASTGNINDAQFMSGGAFTISNPANGVVSNAAKPVPGCAACGITVSNAGLLAFVAPSVANSGTIIATGGRVVLGNAQTATISLNGGLYEIALGQAAGGSVANTGTLSATGGGSIVLSALDAASLVSGTINLAGVQQADTIVVNGGTVELSSSLQGTNVSGSSAVVNVHDTARIQDGVNIAAGGGRVNVAAGTYHEQLKITRSLKLAGAGADGTIITPTSLAADADGMRHILTIGGSAATSVEVSGLQLKGPVPAITSGIFVRDGAHAWIHDNKLIDMRESATLSGNQRGLGILVGRALVDTSGTALIERNEIRGYQKGGIVVDGPGSQATVTGNTIVGEGATTVIAQNGIQASRGASADISGNNVSGNDYTPAGDEATGILIFTPGANLGQGTITVGPNNVRDNEVGIDTNDPRTLSTISLAGVTNNGRNAVAEFTGGFAGGGPLLEFPAWAASGTVRVDATAFAGQQSGDIVDVGGALRVFGWSGFAAIQPAINAVASGGRVDVGAGTYTQTSTLNLHRGVTLAGAGESQTTIDARGVSGSYGILVDADHASLADFTLYGPTASSAASYGIKVQPAGSAASSRLHDFRITNVTSRGAFKAELDLNGVVGAIIDHVTADGAPANGTGTTAGAGIQVTDSADVVIRNSTTRNNAWGGVALFQTNRFFDQQTTNVTVENNNHFTEALPLYMQDESASLDFGALNLPGFSHAVRNSGSADNSQFTWLQSTLQSAVDFAVNVPVPASSTVQGWSGTGLTQNFEVGVGNVLGGGTRAMSIAAAVAASGTGAGIHVGAGTYAENVTLDGLRNLSFGGSTIRSLTVNAGAAGSGIGGSVVADGTPGFVFDAPVVLLGDTTLGTAGANIVFNADIQNAGANPNALTLTAGSGDVTLTSGGTRSNPLGQLHAVSRNFTLRGDMWVTGSAIEVTGAAVLNGQLHGPASLAASLVEALPEEVPLQVLVPPVQVSANTGAGLLSQPGSPVADFTSSLPAAPGQGARGAQLGTIPGGTGNAPPVHSTPNRAGESLDRGRSVEIDLAPGN